MSLELTCRFTLAMVLAPETDYAETMRRLAGHLMRVPWARPWQVPTSKVCLPARPSTRSRSYPGISGPRTAASARVLRANGSVIPGVYAAGNASAAVMGHSYAGAGSTIGPALTLGYVAANYIADNPSA